MNILEKSINTARAGGILKKDRRTINRYIAKGWLRAEQINGQRMILLEDVVLLKEQTRARAKLGSRVKEFYCLRECGISPKEISMEYDLPQKTIVKGIERYKLERLPLLKVYPFDNYENPLFVDEAAARLKLRDWHVIYHLLDEGTLKGYDFMRGKKRKRFVSKESLFDYLGPIKNEFLYTSTDAAKRIGKSVNLIDRLALQHKIGRKVKAGHKNSTYLFTNDNIEALSHAVRIR